MSDYTNECAGCTCDNSTDIKIHLGVCSHCKRAYHDEDERDLHKDLYLRGEDYAGNHR